MDSAMLVTAAILMMAATRVFAADWREFEGTPDGNSWFYDKDSISISRDGVEVWVYRTGKSESGRLLLELDCRLEMARVKTAFYYDRPGLKGAPVDSQSESGDWEPIIDGTIIDSLRDLHCPSDRR